MSDKSGETSLMFALGIVVILCWAFWYFFQDDIALIVGYTRYGYLSLFGFFTDHFRPYHDALGVRVNGQLPLTWPQVERVSTVIGDWMKWPTAALLFYYAYWMLSISPKRKFKTVFNLESLIKIQAKCWPIISPIVNFNPLKESQRVPGSTIPNKLPPFAESLSPEEWVAWQHLPLRDGLPDREDLRQAFTKQLGPKWEGLRGLKDYQRALIAGFVLRGLQKRNESDALLGAIAECWTMQDGLKLTPAVQAQIAAVLNNKADMAEPLKIAAQYAYTKTVMLAILRWARERGGVLAPSSFLWLRAVDRGLWYPLNNLGRRSYHAEAAGVMAHFMAEQLAKKPLPIPRVDTAIPAILDYLKENKPTYPDAEPLPVRDNAKLKVT